MTVIIICNHRYGDCESVRISVPLSSQLDFETILAYNSLYLKKLCDCDGNLWASVMKVWQTASDPLLFSHVLSSLLLFSHVLSSLLLFSHGLSSLLLFSHVLFSLLLFSHVLSSLLLFYHIKSSHVRRYPILFFSTAFYPLLFNYILSSRSLSYPPSPSSYNIPFPCSL